MRANVKRKEESRAAEKELLQRHHESLANLKVRKEWYENHAEKIGTAFLPLRAQERTQSSH